MKNTLRFLIRVAGRPEHVDSMAGLINSACGSREPGRMRFEQAAASGAALPIAARIVAGSFSYHARLARGVGLGDSATS